MFVGVYRVMVAADGTVTLPPPLAAALGQHDLVFEPLEQERGRAIIALPRPGDRACGANGDRVHVPPRLLAEAGIDDIAEFHGMGEYLIIRKVGAAPL